MRTVSDFSGAVILITGGASGMGAELARECSRAGATAIVADVADQAAEDLVASAPGPGPIEAVHLDVSDPVAVDSVVVNIQERHGRIDGLVCGAVIQPISEVLESDSAVLHNVLGVNFFGMVACCRAVAPLMTNRRRGSIVLFSSGTADIGKWGSAAYTASKGAVVGFMKSFALELKPHNVRINIFRAGMVNTPQFVKSNPPSFDTSILDQPDDVVGGLMFLLSDDAVMTGSTLAREMQFSRHREGEDA